MKNNKKILGLSVIAILGASSLNTAQAVDLKARAGIGFAFYELETPEIYGVVNGSNTSLSVGLTAGFGEMYVDAKFDTTIDGDHDTFAGFGGTREDFQRDEITLTAGYSVNESLTVFGGYKSTETALTSPAGYAWEEDNFQADGLFVGGAFGVPVSDNSSISASVAIAALDGDYTDNTYITNAGDTTGISVGLNYNLYLSDTTGIAASWSYQKYSYDMGEDTFLSDSITPTTDPQSVTEKYSNFGVSYFMGF